MRRTHLKRLLSLVLALALTLTLVACGGGTSEAGTVPTESGAEAVTIHYGISNAWDALMPYNSVSGSNYARMVYDKIYDRLAYVHADGTLSPRAAKSWEGSEDGYTALFHLDEKAAFHDGTPVTAKHWVETFTLMTDPTCPVLGRGNFSVFAGTDQDGCRVEGETFGVEATDDYTLKLTFKSPTTPEDFLLDKNREFYVLPTHLLEGADPATLMELDLWKAPVGSGPCKFVEELPGSQLTLEANKDYQLGAPGFDYLVMTVMDKSNLLTALIAGDLDYYAIGGSLSAEDAPLAESSGVTVLEGTVPNTFFELMLNGDSIPDARVRRAIELALDKELLCEQSTHGLGTVAGSSISPESPYADAAVPAGERDVEVAKALLTEAGYDGRSYTLVCTSNRSGLAALMQQNLAEAGINVTIETVDSAAMFAGMSEGTYDMGIASHTPGALPLWFTESRLSATNNIFHVADLTPYTDRVQAIRAETDPDTRLELVTELDDYLAQERPFIPLWFGTALHAKSPTVANIDYPSASFSNENVWEWVKE